jgi:hypothetical protein
MEQTNNINTEAKFKEGFFLVLKKWSAFRLALDNSPEVLSQFSEEDDGKLEINQMLELLMGDIYSELQKNQNEKNIAEMLYFFIEEFFEVGLEDESENDVAKTLVRLYTQLQSGETACLNKLIEIDQRPNTYNYSISFPIQESLLLAKQLDQQMIIDDEDINTNINKKREENEPDEEGFIEVKKKKKK